MKHKIKIYIAIAVLALPAVSCEKWLDVIPKTMQPSEEMFNTYQGYKDALTGCYLKMKNRNLWGEHMTITTVEYLAQHWELWDENEVAEAIKKHEYLDDNVRPIFQRMYAGLFNVIVQANTIIAAMPKTGETAIADPDSRGVVEGEAYAIRALCHFEVLRLFGQVPGGTRSVRLPFTDGVSREPSRYYDYADYIRLIEDDLITAEKLLFEHDPFVKYTVDAVNNTNAAAGTVRDPFLHYRQLRLNYWAVKALQARFYLYTGETGKAYAAANEVI
ncbi:MAG: RagB/SusD family nutrient uptake outer membrane protein, partial [Prevotellaceae bacterium]|nr:RagB/SusD family nutrient uptake outer membrane protein [Prevotellaceae bacterium]